jgi:hypothetical protein
MRYYLILFLLTAITVTAQNPEGHYIIPSFNGYMHRVLDKAQSPVHYRGFGGGLGLGYGWHASKWILEVDISANFGLLKPRSSANPLNTNITLWQGQADSRFLWEIRQHEKTRFMAGINAPVFVQYRNHSNHTNSSETWNAYAMIGPEGGARYTFTLFRRGFVADGFLALPVWGYATKPAFAEFFGLFGENISQRSWRSMVNIQTDLRLCMMLINGNQIGISYRWNYYSDSVDNLSQLAAHRANIFLLFKL